MAKKLNILIAFGTRPEVIKLAPVIAELKKYPAKFDLKICVSGQHRQMIDPLLKLFDIKADYDLNIMQKNQNLEHITSSVLREIGKILDQGKTDYLFVQGDTTTAMAASLAAFYRGVKVGHVEAGLRTWNKSHPFPEEVNRRIIDSVSDLYFAHTKAARQNLINEGVDPKKIEVTGNTVIDALLATAKRKVSFEGTDLGKISFNGRKMILMTAHRRENFGQDMINICKAVKEIVQKFEDEVYFVYPVHLNPNVQHPVRSMLSGIDNVLLTEPLEYLPFVHLMKKAYLVLTDSGGLQEEAPSLGKPVLVMRETTERPEGVQAGCVEIIGTDTQRIVRKVTQLLENKRKYQRMAKAKNPYGNGTAAQKIVKRMLKEAISYKP